MTDPYKAATITRLASWLADAESEAIRWKYVAEFLEEYRWEPLEARPSLLEPIPSSTGNEQWDVFLAALAEFLANRDERAAPDWAHARTLRQFWFPFNTPAARADAIVHAPAAFRKRGIFVAYRELEVA